MTLALEMLARAAVAKKHPVLLADPQNGGGDSVFYALGLPSPSEPKSITAKTLFHRCEKLIPQFTVKELKQCLAWADIRNRELHTGDPAFQTIAQSEWLPEYYRISQILLRECEKELADFVGDDEGAVAVAIIADIEKVTADETLAAVKNAQAAFSRLPEPDRIRRKELAQQGANRGRSIAYYSPRHDWTKTVQCPSCSSPASLTGTLTRSSEPHLKEGRIVQEHTFLPISLHCEACDLKLMGYSSLRVVDLGAPFVRVEEHDPVEFHGIDPYEFIDFNEAVERLGYGEDYGND